MDFSQTQTAAGLMRAFAGESQAQMRYTLAAKLAERQQLPLIGQVFRFTAKQENTLPITSCTGSGSRLSAVFLLSAKREKV